MNYEHPGRSTIITVPKMTSVITHFRIIIETRGPTPTCAAVIVLQQWFFDD